MTTTSMPFKNHKMLEGLDKKLNKLITDLTILRREIEEQKPKLVKKENPDTIFWSGFHWLKYDDE
jgi:hypothetical protein